MVFVIQYIVRLSASICGGKTDSGSPLQSDQPLNFSRIQAARPTGESARP